MSDIDSTIEKCIEKIWNTYDKDNSGFLDKAETKAFVKDTLTVMGENGEFYEADFEPCFKELDLDGSGAISKYEMKIFIKKVTGRRTSKSTQKPLSTVNQSLSGLKVVNVRELSQSPSKKQDFPSPPLPPESEVDEENLKWLKQRPVRSSEKRRHFYLEAAKFNIEEFFDDRDDDAKLRALVQAPFVYDVKRANEDPEETSHIRWCKLMNVLLPDRFNRKVVDMIKFEWNEYEILHRNMPFMFRKDSKSNLIQNQSR